MFSNEVNPPLSEDIEASIVNMLDNLASDCRKYIDISSSAVGLGNDLDTERLRLCLEEIVWSPQNAFTKFHRLKQFQGMMEEMSKIIYSNRTKKKSFRKAQKLYNRLKVLTEEVCV